MWEDVGRLQFEFLRSRGLKSADRLLDLGCGCLRGGVHFVDYLDSGHYYGMDLSQELLDAGYEEELGPLGLKPKLPRENLVCDDDFDATGFGVSFDAVLAQSVFTHLSLNHLKLCLIRTADVVRVGGQFYVTVFLARQGEDWSRPLFHETGGVTTYPAQDPFHCTPDDLEYCCKGMPWKLELVGDWGHPRDQLMAIYVRTE